MKPSIAHFTVIGRLPFPSNIWIYDCVPLVWRGSTSNLKFKRFVCARILRHRRAVCIFCDISRSLDLNEFAPTQSDVNVDHAGSLPTTLVVRPVAATAQYLLQFLVLGLITHQCICVCRVAALSKLLDGSNCVWRLIRPIVQGSVNRWTDEYDRLQYLAIPLSWLVVILIRTRVRRSYTSPYSYFQNGNA